MNNIPFYICALTYFIYKSTIRFTVKCRCQDNPLSEGGLNLANLTCSVCANKVKPPEGVLTLAPHGNKERLSNYVIGTNDINLLSLDDFNTIFNSNIINLPLHTAGFGCTVKCRCQDHPLSEGGLNLANLTCSVCANKVKPPEGVLTLAPHGINNNFYICVDNLNHHEKLEYIISYWIENIKLNKYYFLVCYNDGYRTTIPNYDNNIFNDYITVINDNNIENNLKNNIILTFSKYINDDDNIICIPDFHYIKSHGYETTIQLIDNNFINFDQKINMCIWRGQNTSDFYYNFIEYDKIGPIKNIIKIPESDNNITNGPRNYFIDLYNQNKFNNVDYNSEFTSIEEQIKYKYILDIDGWASTWSATFWKLYSGSVLLKQKSVWKQWYYDDLIEYVHYVPIANDFSDLNEKIQWCIDNDDKCKEITKNSRKFVIEKLSWNQVKNDLINILQNIEK